MKDPQWDVLQVYGDFGFFLQGGMEFEYYFQNKKEKFIAFFVALDV